MKFSHVVFDVDGTLVDTRYSVIQSLKDTLYQLRGEKWEDADLTFALGITGKAVLQRLGFTDTDTVLEQWVENMAPYVYTNRLFPGIRELLEELKAMGCTTGVVTSRMRSLFDAEIPALGIRELLDYVICADDSVTHKPEAGPLEAYLSQSGAEKQDVIYIGDSIYDAQCAANAGVAFALAGWGAVEELRREAPDCPMEPEEIRKRILGGTVR